MFEAVGEASGALGIVNITEFDPDGVQTPICNVCLKYVPSGIVQDASRK